MRLVAAQIQLQYAHEDPSGEIGDLVPPLTFQVSAAEWLRGWDWRSDVESPLAALEKARKHDDRPAE